MESNDFQTNSRNYTKYLVINFLKCFQQDSPQFSKGRKYFGDWKDVPASRTKPTGGHCVARSPRVKHTSAEDNKSI
jgi:hypothetical protein